MSFIRAAKGGQIGINGEFYKGGCFLPETIFCDPWQNACKKAKNKNQKIINTAKKNDFGLIVKDEKGLTAIEVTNESSSKVYNEMIKNFNSRNIVGFEWYKNGKLLQCGGEDF